MRLLALAVFIACTIASGAGANVVRNDDAEQIGSLIAEAGELGKEIHGAAVAATKSIILSGSPNVSEAINLDSCFSTMGNAVSNAMYTLFFAHLILEMSSVMVDDLDQSTSLVAVEEALSTIRDRIKELRAGANEAAGSCRNSVVVNTKAQSVLNFATVIERAAAPISKRVADAQHKKK